MDELVIDSVLLLAQGRIIYSHPFSCFIILLTIALLLITQTAGTMTTLAGERALK